MNEKSQPSGNEIIKRVTWLDLYIINDKDRKILGTKFDDAIEEASTAKNTPGVIKILNRLAFTNGISKKEKFAWLRIKDWIFEQIIINKDTRLSILTSPDEIDKANLHDIELERKKRGIDAYGARKGSYIEATFTDPISLLDYEISEKQIENEKKSKELSPIDRPGNFENFIYKRLAEIKKLKKGPVVFVDFGGVMGITTLKLAKKFKIEIERGEIVLIVTNLLADKDEIKEYIKQSRYEEDMKSWMLKTMNLVHYIQADAKELQNASVNLPNNKDFAIDGNVDFIYEQNAITIHGYANDKDFSILGEILSSYGLLVTNKVHREGSKPIDSHIENVRSIIEKAFVVNEGYSGIHKRSHEIIKKSRTLSWRDAKKKKAYENMTTILGLINIDALPLSNGKAIELLHSFFIHPNAPSLKFTDRFDHKYEIPLEAEARASKLDCYTRNEIGKGWRAEGK